MSGTPLLVGAALAAMGSQCINTCAIAAKVDPKK